MDWSRWMERRDKRTEKRQSGFQLWYLLRLIMGRWSFYQKINKFMCHVCEWCVYLKFQQNTSNSSTQLMWGRTVCSKCSNSRRFVSSSSVQISLRWSKGWKQWWSEEWNCMLTHQQRWVPFKEQDLVEWNTFKSIIYFFKISCGWKFSVCARSAQRWIRQIWERKS